MGAKIGGAVVLVILGTLALAALIRWPVLWLAPTVVGGVWIVVNERRLKIENPSPPPPGAPSENEEPQFSYVEDRPGHWAVTREDKA